MTTVAMRAGVIAADRQMDGHMCVGKLFRLKSGAYLAGAGNYDDIVEVVHWFNQGAKEDSKPAIDADDDDLLMMHPDGKMFWLTVPFLRPVAILDEFAACGSGSEFALGAMAAGASAKRAVEIACKFDPLTGKGVNAIRVKK